MGEFEPNDDGRIQPRGRGRAAKLDKRFKRGHWELLAELAALGPDDDMQLFDDDIRGRGRTLAKRGYAELIEDKGQTPGYVITAAGREALHDAQLKGWI